MRNKTSTVLATLAIFLSFHTNPVFAHSIAETIQLKESIARNPKPLQIGSDEEDYSKTEDRSRSMQLIESGMEAEGEGNQALALSKYRAAIQADSSNGHAYLVLGHLLINAEINLQLGIDCVKLAAERFEAENDIECYKLAYELLKIANAE